MSPSEYQHLVELLAKTFSRIDARFDKVDERFDAVDERFDKVDARFDAVDERFDKVEGRLTRVEVRLEHLHGEVKAVAELTGANGRRIDENRALIEANGVRIGRLELLLDVPRA